MAAKKKKTSKVLEKKIKNSKNTRTARNKKIITKKKTAQEQIKKLKVIKKNKYTIQNRKTSIDGSKKKHVTARMALKKTKVTKKGVELGHVHNNHIISEPTKFKN